jgi:hypothetical protein
MRERNRFRHDGQEVASHLGNMPIAPLVLKTWAGWRLPYPLIFLTTEN